jgi:hypothetical protein
MAFGIRELSKKLAQIRLKLHVRNIFILAKAHDETLIKHTRETTDWLLTKDPKYKVYVEETLEYNKLFDAQGLLEKNPEYNGRLKFWTNELCAEKPHSFDIVLAVCMPTSAVEQTLTRTARRRRHRTLRVMAFPTHRPSRHRLFFRLSRLPHQIRLRSVPHYSLARLRGRNNSQSTLAIRSDRHALAEPR